VRGADRERDLSVSCINRHANHQKAVTIKNLPACCYTGLVFLAFALNLVDCGGLLGGRLGDSRPPRKHKKSMSMQPLQATGGLTERTYTCKF